jgi:hypothetical protein
MTGQPDGSAAIATAQAQSAGWLEQAEKLRFGFAVPGPGAVPEQIRDALLTARAHMDSLETYLSMAINQRAAFRTRAREIRAAADDNWDRLAATANQQGRGARDYEGSKERYSRFNVDNFGPEREARLWRQASEIADECYDRIRLHYYGLRDTVMDLREALRSFTLESNLDR